MGRAGATMMPDPERRTTLYRYFDQDGTLLYVGITGAGHDRAEAHWRDSPWWHLTASARLEHLATRREALAAELVAIRTERPLYNRRDHPDRVRLKAPPRSYSDRPKRTSGWISSAKRLRGRGMTVPQIADQLGMPVSAVRVELSEDRRRQRDRLQRSWRDLIRTIHRAGWPHFEVDP